MNRHTVGILNADCEGLNLDTEVEIVGILAGWRFVMETIVRIVEPPFAIDIDEFSLALKEVSVMLGLPSDTIAIVGKCSVC